MDASRLFLQIRVLYGSKGSPHLKREGVPSVRTVWEMADDVVLAAGANYIVAPCDSVMAKRGQLDFGPHKVSASFCIQPPHLVWTSLRYRTSKGMGRHLINGGLMALMWIG